MNRGILGPAWQELCTALKGNHTLVKISLGGRSPQIWKRCVYPTWMVHVVGDPEKDFVNCELVVVAASDEEDAQKKAKTAKNLVTLKQVPSGTRGTTRVSNLFSSLQTDQPKKKSQRTG